MMAAMANRDFSMYLTWSDDDEKCQLVCTDAGMASVPPGSPYPPNSNGHPSAFKSVATGRTINEYQLVYITRGQGSFQSGSQRFDVAAGSVLAIFPGLRHAYRPDPQTGWDEYWVGFQGAHVDRLRDSGFHIPQRCCFPVGLHQSLVAIFDDIFATVTVQEPYYQFKAGALILLLLSEVLGRSRKAEQDGGAAALVEQAKLAMQQAVDTALRIDSIAGQLGVSMDRFYGAFKDYTGMTPYQYFIQLKINKAKRLLDAESASVKAVALSLGFEDPYYFSRLFKKKTGMAPSTWGGVHQEQTID
jgi:AraC-like DNA-binding protein